MKYPVAPNGIFDTIQGEGSLSGTPMTFIRLAGCSVGCPQCDTDYRVHERLSIAEITERIERLPRRRWLWLTGGEPTDHDIEPLTTWLNDCGWLVAIATSGKRRLGDGWGGWHGFANHLYVSPHTASGPVQTMGEEINVVPGLNGLLLSDVESWDLRGFPTKWVTPCDKINNIRECVEWVKNHDGWRLNVQAHKQWGVA